MRQHAGTGITSMVDAANATPGRRFPYGGWRDETAVAIASEGALTLIGASLNKLVFSTILRSRRRPMQEASAYGASSSSPRHSGEVPFTIPFVDLRQS